MLPPAAPNPASLLRVMGDGPVPSEDGAVPTGWQGFVFDGDMGTPQVIAYAICARAPGEAAGRAPAEGLA